MPEEEIGTIAHYYNHIEGGLIELTASLKIGDAIHIKAPTMISPKLWNP